jgi:hypothetical protein
VVYWNEEDWKLNPFATNVKVGPRMLMKRIPKVYWPCWVDRDIVQDGEGGLLLDDYALAARGKAGILTCSCTICGSS